MFFFRKPAPPHFDVLYLYCDGATRLQPPAASAAVVARDRRGQIVDWFSRVIPSVTNNEAEYNGFLYALEIAERLRPAKAVFQLDSQIVVGQVTGRFDTRDARLRALCRKAQDRRQKLKEAGTETSIFYLPREFNRLADALAADALVILPEPYNRPFQLPGIK